MSSIFFFSDRYCADGKGSRVQATENFSSHVHKQRSMEHHSAIVTTRKKTYTVVFPVVFVFPRRCAIIIMHFSPTCFCQTKKYLNKKYFLFLSISFSVSFSSLLIPAFGKVQVISNLWVNLFLAFCLFLACSFLCRRPTPAPTSHGSPSPSPAHFSFLPRTLSFGFFSPSLSLLQR